MTVLDIAKAAVSPRRRRRIGSPAFTALVVVAAGFVGLAVFGPMIAPYPPEATDILAAGQGPNSAHWLGTDALGRDVLSRLLTGARLTFLAAFLITVFSSLVGFALALVTAWHGGWIDAAVGKVLDIMFSIPGILIAILAVALSNPGFWPPVVALSIVYVPYFARVLRSAAVEQRRRAYVEAAELAGLSSWRISIFHIGRNILPLALAQATFSFAASMVEFGAISFLGLGVQPPSSEWGLMVSEGRSDLLAGHPEVSVSAGIMIIAAVVVFNMLGEQISSRMAVSR